MPNSGAVGSSIASVLAVIGGAYAGYRGKQNAQAYEAQKNARETLEKTVIGPAIQSGESQLFDLHEKTLKQHYTKDQIDLMKSMAETQSVENRTKKMTTMLQGLEGGQSQPAAQPVPATSPPSGVSASNASSGTPDVLQALTGPQPQAQTAPTAMPVSESKMDPRYEGIVAGQRGELLAKDKYIQELEGKLGIANPAPTRTAQAAPAQPTPKILPLGAKNNYTITEGGKLTINKTVPSVQDQAGHEAQAKQQIGWLDSNPHVLRALGPQIRDAIAAGNPQAMKLVDDMQKNPSVMPRVDDLLAADKITDYTQRRDAVMRLFGDPAKASQYLAQHPPADAIDTSKLQQEVAVEARKIAVEKKLPQEYVTPEVVSQAQRAVMQRKAEERQMTSDQVLARMETMGRNRAQSAAALQNSQILLRKLPEDSAIVGRAEMALRNITQVGDMVYSNKALTGFNPADAQVKRIQAALQQGDKGAAMAGIQGWIVDLAIADQRLFGASARMAASILEKQETAIPNPIKDNQKAFNNKVTRLLDLVKTVKGKMEANLNGAHAILKASPLTAPIADAVRQGHYDASIGYLDAQAKQLMAPENNVTVPPVINFGAGDAR